MYHRDAGDSLSELHQTLRDRLSAPKMQQKYTFAEGEDVHYYQSSSPIQGPGIRFGRGVLSRGYDRVFWVAPKTGIMDDQRKMESFLDEASRGLYTRTDTLARRNNHGLVYGRRDFWENPYRTLNTELVILPHRTVLDMVSNYYRNKDDFHPVNAFESPVGLGFVVTFDQLRRLKDQESWLRREAQSVRQIAERFQPLVRDIGSRFHGKER